MCPGRIYFALERGFLWRKMLLLRNKLVVLKERRILSFGWFIQSFAIHAWNKVSKISISRAVCTNHWSYSIASNIISDFMPEPDVDIHKQVWTLVSPGNFKVHLDIGLLIAKCSCSLLKGGYLLYGWSQGKGLQCIFCRIYGQAVTSLEICL